MRSSVHEKLKGSTSHRKNEWEIKKLPLKEKEKSRKCAEDTAPLDYLFLPPYRKVKGERRKKDDLTIMGCRHRRRGEEGRLLWLCTVF